MSDVHFVWFWPHIYMRKNVACHLTKEEFFLLTFEYPTSMARGDTRHVDDAGHYTPLPDPEQDPPHFTVGRYPLIVALDIFFHHSPHVLNQKLRAVAVGLLIGTLIAFSN